MPLLKVHKKELKKKYWMSLEYDPEGSPFSFQYDANESKKKRPRDEEQDEPQPVAPHSMVTTEQLQQAEQAGAQKVLDKLEEFVMKYHKKLLDDISTHVVSLILEQSEDASHVHQTTNTPPVHQTTMTHDMPHAGASQSLTPPTANEEEHVQETEATVVHEPHVVAAVEVTFEAPVAVHPAMVVEPPVDVELPVASKMQQASEAATTLQMEDNGGGVTAGLGDALVDDGGPATAEVGEAKTESDQV